MTLMFPVLQFNPAHDRATGRFSSGSRSSSIERIKQHVDDLQINADISDKRLRLIANVIDEVVTNADLPRISTLKIDDIADAAFIETVGDAKRQKLPQGSVYLGTRWDNDDERLERLRESNEATKRRLRQNDYPSLEHRASDERLLDGEQRQLERIKSGAPRPYDKMSTYAAEAFHDSLEGALRHELGHSFMAKNKRDLKQFKVDYMRQRGIDEDTLVKQLAVSWRGGFRFDEAVAEAFTLYSGGRRDVVQPELNAFFDSHTTYGRQTKSFVTMANLVHDKVTGQFASKTGVSSGSGSTTVVGGGRVGRYPQEMRFRRAARGMAEIPLDAYERMIPFEMAFAKHVKTAIDYAVNGGGDLSSITSLTISLIRGEGYKDVFLSDSLLGEALPGGKIVMYDVIMKRHPVYVAGSLVHEAAHAADPLAHVGVGKPVEEAKRARAATETLAIRAGIRWASKQLTVEKEMGAKKALRKFIKGEKEYWSWIVGGKYSDE